MVESKSTYVIVREYPSVKERLWQEAKDNGYERLSDYVRLLWSHLHEEGTI